MTTAYADGTQVVGTFLTEDGTEVEIPATVLGHVLIKHTGALMYRVQPHGSIDAISDKYARNGALGLPATRVRRG